MEAFIDYKMVYCVADFLDAGNFFRNLPTLLSREDWTIGIGSYNLAPAVRTWFDSQSQKEIPREYDFHRLFEIHRDDYPLGGAFCLPARVEILTQLEKFAIDCKSSEFSCDHVIGFDKDGALFSFHDAFQGGRLLITPMILKRNVEKFCSEINASFNLVVNPQKGGEKIYNAAKKGRMGVVNGLSNVNGS
jgi:hypothetical protein